jgi:hypothetical protein
MVWRAIVICKIALHPTVDSGSDRRLDLDSTMVLETRPEECVSSQNV